METETIFAKMSIKPLAIAIIYVFRPSDPNRTIDTITSISGPNREIIVPTRDTIAKILMLASEKQLIIAKFISS